VGKPREEPVGEADLRAVLAAAQHVWVAIAFVFAWLHFDYVHSYFRHPDWQLYTLYLLAVAGVAARYLTGQRHGKERWHRLAFDGLTVFFIALGVNLTGGIRSDLWLVYFIFVIAETLAATPRAVLLTDGVAVLSYVVATWPREVNQQWAEMLGTRLFFLMLVASIVRTLAREESRKQEHLAALREALSVSEERRRLARDLHDGIGHVLTRVILSLELARRQVPREPQAAAETVAQQAHSLRGAMQEMRQLVATLRSDTIAFDLLAALRTLVAQLRESGSMEVRVLAAPATIPLTAHRQYHLTRVIQEALTNCLRHSGAETATVKITIAGVPIGPPKVVVEVADNGGGFEVAQVGARAGQGLTGMRERLEPYGGTVFIESALGRGTRVIAEIPADLASWPTTAINGAPPRPQPDRGASTPHELRIAG
jgi:signal transduction histidine kinase